MRESDKPNEKQHAVGNLVFSDQNGDVIAFYHGESDYLRARTASGFDIIINSKYLTGDDFQIPIISANDPELFSIGNYLLLCLRDNVFYRCGSVVSDLGFKFAVVWKDQGVLEENKIHSDIEIAKQYVSARISK